MRVKLTVVALAALLAGCASTTPGPGPSLPAPSTQAPQLTDLVINGVSVAGVVDKAVEVESIDIWFRVIAPASPATCGNVQITATSGVPYYCASDNYVAVPSGLPEAWKNVPPAAVVYRLGFAIARTYSGLPGDPNVACAAAYLAAAMYPEAGAQVTADAATQGTTYAAGAEYGFKQRGDGKPLSDCRTLPAGGR